MKSISKLTIISVCILLLTILAACGGNGDSNSNSSNSNSSNSSGNGSSGAVNGDSAAAPEKTPEETPGAAAQPPSIAPLTLEADFGIYVDGEWFAIRQDAAGLIEALGSDYELTAAPSCAFAGEDKEFAYPHCAVYTNPDGEIDIWYLIALYDDTLQTARGIKTGEGTDAIFKAYGEGYYREGESVLTYSISGIEGDSASPCIIFTLDGDKIELIEIYYPAADLPG